MRKLVSGPVLGCFKMKLVLLDKQIKETISQFICKGLFSYFNFQPVINLLYPYYQPAFLTINLLSWAFTPYVQGAFQLFQLSTYYPAFLTINLLSWVFTPYVQGAAP